MNNRTITWKNKEPLFFPSVKKELVILSKSFAYAQRMFNLLSLFGFLPFYLVLFLDETNTKASLTEADGDVA